MDTGEENDGNEDDDKLEEEGAEEEDQGDEVEEGHDGEEVEEEEEGGNGDNEEFDENDSMEGEEEDSNSEGNGSSEENVDDDNGKQDGDNDDHDDDGDEEDFGQEEEEKVDQETVTKRKKTNSSKPKASKRAEAIGDADYGVSRGIDFQGVNFVINFDFPATAAAYTHRVGRTARGGANGTALSFVTRADGVVKGKEREIAERAGRLLQQVRAQQPRLPYLESGDNVLNALATSSAAGSDDFDGESRMQPSPLLFNLRELDSFRYRVEDTLKGVTSIAVKEFRTAEIKREILNSAKLRTFFANNPNDLKVLLIFYNKKGSTLAEVFTFHRLFVMTRQFFILFDKSSI